ncbi:reverse transcriptase [Caerostris darwini]|uniref:Reverse transcriptase n=1 Tax=Caerostris darwini TaxID=1538125 RepID=A0AAV4MVC5_9ARAC|nr:reverse transcriptase [Caerostris darwini]
MKSRVITDTQNSNGPRDKFWNLSLLQSCHSSYRMISRYRSKTVKQLMGDLPKARVEISRAITNCAWDFTESIEIKLAKGLGQKFTKAYITLFVCLATKALHVELVGDLTSESFISAFRRFISRCGCRDVVAHSHFLIEEKLSFLPDETQKMSYPIELDGNLFKTSGKGDQNFPRVIHQGSIRIFGKRSRESIYIFSSKERSGENWKIISKLETYSV